MADEELTGADRERPLRELQEELSELRALANHRGFKKLLFIADEQCKSRVDTLVLTPLETLDGALKQEYAKGEIGGIKLFMQMTQAQIDLLETEIETLLKEQDHDSSETLDETAGT